jgi:flagellar FliL protein
VNCFVVVGMSPKTPTAPASPAASLSTAAEIPSAAAPKKVSLSKVFVIGSLLLAVVGGTAWFFQRGSTTASAENGKQKATPALVHLDGFTVNLADPEENHFLRVSMDLAVERVPPPKEHDKPNSGLPMPQIRDSILSVLTTSKADALLSSEGKAKLKKSLLDTLNHDDPDLGVREIYFTEFLVQR